MPEPQWCAGAQQRPATAAAAERRRAIVAAVLATGNPPRLGSRNGWSDEQWAVIGDQFGISAGNASYLWQEAKRRGEVTLPEGAQCPGCGKALNVARLCADCDPARPRCARCDRAVVSRGLCGRHYKQHRQHVHAQMKRQEA